jgi:hypothetical protein
VAAVVVEHCRGLHLVQVVQAAAVAQHLLMAALDRLIQAAAVQAVAIQGQAAAMVVQVLLFLNTQTPAQLQLVLV